MFGSMKQRGQAWKPSKPVITVSVVALIVIVYLIFSTRWLPSFHTMTGFGLSSSAGGGGGVGGYSKWLPATPSDPRIIYNQLLAHNVESVRTATLIPLQSESVPPFWVAFPDKLTNRELEGADWYDQVYRDHHFGAQEWYEEMLKHVPCETGGNDYFIQIGSHLGVFTLFGAAYGCRVLAVDTFDWTVLFMRLSAALNGWADRFIALNAAGGSGTEGATILFDPTDTSVKTETKSYDATKKSQRNAREVPVVTLDHLRSELHTAHAATAASAASASAATATTTAVASASDPAAGTAAGRIHFCVIDVEGFENAVLLGAHALIASREVSIWNVEVWFRRDNIDRRDPVLHFSGMQLLWDARYVVFGLYDAPGYHGRSVTRPLKSLQQLIDTAPLSSECKSGGNAASCLVEIFAVRDDVVSDVARVNPGSGRPFRPRSL